MIDFIYTIYQNESILDILIRKVFLKLRIFEEYFDDFNDNSFYIEVKSVFRYNFIFRILAAKYYQLLVANVLHQHFRIYLIHGGSILSVNKVYFNN
jgi:hypothetical protein